MGAWSVSITGNDTAENLKSEYQAAFFYYDIETALSNIDKYVRAVGFDESDEEEWCNYYYSLADFMWRKGILTFDYSMYEKDELLRFYVPILAKTEIAIINLYRNYPRWESYECLAELSAIFKDFVSFEAERHKFS